MDWQAVGAISWLTSGFPRPGAGPDSNSLCVGELRLSELPTCLLGRFPWVVVNVGTSSGTRRGDRKFLDTCREAGKLA